MPRTTSTTKTTKTSTTKKTPSTTKEKTTAKPQTKPRASGGVSFAQLQRDALQLGYKVTKSAKGITAFKDGAVPDRVLFAQVKDLETWLDEKIANGLQPETDLLEEQPSELLDKDNESTSATEDAKDEATEDEEFSIANVNLIDRKIETFFFSYIPITPEVKAMLQDLHDLCDYDSLDAWTRIQVCKAFKLPQGINDLDLAQAIAKMGLSLKVYEHPDIMLAYNVYDPQAQKS